MVTVNMSVVNEFFTQHCLSWSGMCSKRHRKAWFGFPQLTFTKPFSVIIWLGTILALTMSMIAMRPICGCHIGPFKDFIITI